MGFFSGFWADAFEVVRFSIGMGLERAGKRVAPVFWPSRNFPVTREQCRAISGLQTLCKMSDSPLSCRRESLGSKHEMEMAFKRLFDLYYPMIQRWLMGLGFNRQEAEDVAQETFIRVYGGLEEFRGDSSPYTWIRSIARRQASNHLRKVNAKKRRSVEISLEEGVEARGPGLFEASHDPDPQKSLLLNEMLELVGRAIEGLPPRRRQCVSLLARGFQYQEIALSLGISIETVKSHLHQARKQLKGRLGEYLCQFDVNQEEEE